MSAATLRPSIGAGSTIGLIGMGLLGTALAERLILARVNVIGWDIVPERQEALASAGGICAKDAAVVFSKCDRILLSLPTHETVRDVLQSADGILRSGQIVIDTSTGDPDAACEQASRLSRRGVEYLDATISGSSQQVHEGTAVFLIGGSDFAYISCLDIFEWLCFKSYHAGPAGSGARMKLVTNLVLGLNRAALAEGLCFARMLGLNLDQALFLLRESMSYSRTMDTKGEKMLHGNFTPEAKLSQHLKDVHLMLDAARQANSSLPLTEAHRRLLEAAVAQGLGDLDNSAIMKVIESSPAPTPSAAPRS